jgi:hypothetical protein
MTKKKQIKNVRKILNNKKNLFLLQSNTQAIKQIRFGVNLKSFNLKSK